MTEKKDWEIARDERNAVIDEAIKDFTVNCTYIPFDVDSLRTKPNDPHFHGKGSLKAEDLNKLQLKYTVDVFYKGRRILTTPYSMGIGHIPEKSGPPAQRGWTHDRVHWITDVFKTGMAGKWSETFGQVNRQPILPEKRSVIWCLVQDSSVIDYGTFEQWASDLGYDTDSRKAEETYRACLTIALSLRAGVGEEVLRQLREVFQDY